MLNLTSLGEVAGLLGTTEAELARTLGRVDQLSHRLLIHDLDKPDKKPREVFDPSGPLRLLQKALHANVLLPRLERSPHSFGGVQGRNQLRCVRRHLGQKFVYTGDIRQFYPSIHFQRVQGLFLRLGCSEEVARALTRLTTNQHRLEQGFITSPILADQLLHRTDERIARLCVRCGLIYTRYVDDISISGQFNILKSGIPATIATLLRGTGLPLNEDKNDGGSLNRKAAILGLRLSKGRPDVSPDYADETARRLKDMAALGRGEQFTGPFFTRDELFGRLRYVCWVNPNRKANLYPLWHQLKWKRIHQAAQDRGIVTRESRYVIERLEAESTTN